MTAALQIHNTALRQAIEAHGGAVFSVVVRPDQVDALSDRIPLLAGRTQIDGTATAGDQWRFHAHPLRLENMILGLSPRTKTSRFPLRARGTDGGAFSESHS